MAPRELAGDRSPTSEQLLDSARVETGQVADRSEPRGAKLDPRLGTDPPHAFELVETAAGTDGGGLNRLDVASGETVAETSLEGPADSIQSLLDGLAGRLIGAQAKFLEEQLTDHPAYRVETYALCNGRRPPDSALRKYLVSGTYRGHRYKNIAITRVGGGPSPSPVSKHFNRASVPRIRASDHHDGPRGLTSWLNYFDKHPERRYVSDGNPRTVTVPKELRDRVDPARLNGATLIPYERKPL